MTKQQYEKLSGKLIEKIVSLKIELADKTLEMIKIESRCNAEYSKLKSDVQTLTETLDIINPQTEVHLTEEEWKMQTN